MSERDPEQIAAGPNRCCANCRAFRENDGDGRGICLDMNGFEVGPNSVCTRWRLTDAVRAILENPDGNQ